MNAECYGPAHKDCITALQVYQVVSTAMATLDNVVELYSRNNLPSLPGLPPNEPIVATIRLRHSLEFQSGSTVQITFESTEVKTTGMAWLSYLTAWCPKRHPNSHRHAHALAVTAGLACVLRVVRLRQLFCYALLACTCRQARPGSCVVSLIQVTSAK